MSRPNTGSTWLFPGETVGQPVREIRRFWARVQKEADLPDVRIHDLRHTFASLLVSGGASLEMIGRLLGHSQMQTTQRYAHLMARSRSCPWPPALGSGDRRTSQRAQRR